MTASQEAVGGRALLLHAHPGHELRLFHWMEQHKPTLFLLTDGSGSGAPRTHHSLETALRAGARAGAVFGLATDLDWYSAILAADRKLFDKAISETVQAAIARDCALIVSDAVDGYNPMHDLCEVIAASAVLALKRSGRSIRHLVVRAASGGNDDDLVTEIQLDEQARRRKQAAIDAYTPLAEEARRLLDDDPGALSLEQLRRPTFAWDADWSPSWEGIGASRVAASKYAQRIEYARHVRPLALALLGEGPAIEAVESGERLDCAY